MRALTFSLILGVLGGSFCLAQSYRCDWSVVGSGGGEMSNTAYRCGGTAGQTAAGQLTGTAYRALIGFWQAEGQVGIEEQVQWPGGQALETRLYAPAPNPSRGRVAIRYSLAASGPAAIQVYDRVGRLVRSWTVSREPSAVSSLTWDGRDSNGRLLANGIYFCRLVVPGLRHDSDSGDGIGSYPKPLTEKLVLQR